MSEELYQKTVDHIRETLNGMDTGNEQLHYIMALSTWLLRENLRQVGDEKFERSLSIILKTVATVSNAGKSAAH